MFHKLILSELFVIQKELSQRVTAELVKSTHKKMHHMNSSTKQICSSTFKSKTILKSDKKLCIPYPNKFACCGKYTHGHKNMHAFLRGIGTHLNLSKNSRESKVENINNNL